MADNKIDNSNVGEMSRQSSMSERVEGIGTWMAMSVIAAFFSSLERCSCINLSTAEDEFDDEEEAKDRPLMLSRPTFIVDEDSVHSV